MGAPNKPRVKAVKKARPNMRGENCHLYWRWRDPETRPMMLAMVRESGKKGGRPSGVADGYTKKITDMLRARNEARAEQIIRAMAETDEDIAPEDQEVANRLKAVVDAEQLVDDEKQTARAAMKEAIVIALMPGNMQMKMQAIRTVLEYSKAKPASTVNSNINPAESFLEALAAKGG